MIERVIRTLKEKDVEIVENASLEHLNSMRISSFSRALAIPKTIDLLVLSIETLLSENVNFRVIGGMTNTLVKNDFYDGVLIKTTKLQRKSRAENIFTLECGVSTAALIAEGVRLGYGGYEGLGGIPGTIGGAVYGNAGAFGSCISDCFLSGELYDIDKGRVTELKQADMRFSYRSSIMKQRRLVLLRASFSLRATSKESSMSHLGEFSRQRRNRQPTDIPSLGSIFKRAGEVGAGYYIEGAGLKGFSVGDAIVSDKHAGFIVNRGSATSDDVLRLISVIQDEVFKKYGVMLEPEIQIL